NDSALTFRYYLLVNFFSEPFRARALGTLAGLAFSGCASRELRDPVETLALQALVFPTPIIDRPLEVAPMSLEEISELPLEEVARLVKQGNVTICDALLCISREKDPNLSLEKLREIREEVLAAADRFADRLEEQRL